ncbi:MAG: nucleotide exchange factor GrpE [Prevotellaceae bacterium]|jgi:molecular chaperone GrpE|nr:nucleotide exchange factor GrpE [Prevotellaceae bacterium]
MDRNILNNQETKPEDSKLQVENAEEITKAGFDGSENEKRIAEISEKLADSEDKYLRLAAEFDNYRKRTLKEKYDLIKTAGEEIIGDLLPVIDDFDRALDAIKSSDDFEALSEGVKLIYDKLSSVLTRRGLTCVEVIDSDFDPEIHEAVAKTPASDEKKGKVVDVIQKGYSLNDKIIRHPKVIVGE